MVAVTRSLLSSVEARARFDASMIVSQDWSRSARYSSSLPGKCWYSTGLDTPARSAMSSMAAAWYPWATKTSWAAASNCLRRAERGNRTGRPAVCVPLVAAMSILRISAVRTRRGEQLTAVPQHGSLTWETERWAVDETAQPGNEQVGVGDEASVTPTNAWQPGSNGGYRDNGSRRAPSLRTADAPWSSAGAALEPSVEPAANGWRRSATSGLRGRAEVRTRYADLLAPVSPAIPPPHAQADEIPSSAPPYPYEGDLPADSRAWAPPRAADRPPAIPAERVAPPAGYDPYHPSGALTDPTYDDLPALAQQAAAASHAASAARAASAAAAAAEARAMVDDRAAVQAAFRNATNAPGTPVPPPASPPAQAAPAEHRPPFPPVNGTEPGRANGTPRPPVNGFGHSAPPTNGAVDPRGPVPPADHRPPGVLWPAELQRAAEAQQVAEVP